jgi:hypothetical protein
MQRIIDYLKENALAFTTLATWVGVILALVGMCIAGFTFRSAQQSARRSLGIEVLLRLDARFNSKRMRCARSQAAGVLAELSNNQTTTDDERLWAADDVLDFFEDLGLLLSEHVLNAIVVHSYFSHWIEGYWSAAEKYLTYVRERDPAAWIDFQDLYRRMMVIEQKVAGKNAKRSPAELSRFSDEELRVCMGE